MGVVSCNCREVVVGACGCGRGSRCQCGTTTALKIWHLRMNCEASHFTILLQVLVQHHSRVLHVDELHTRCQRPGLVPNRWRGECGRVRL